MGAGFAGGQGAAGGQGGQTEGHAACGAGAGPGPGNSGAQAASARHAHSRMRRASVNRVNRHSPMWVVFLEMGVALGLLIVIVWWTWPKKRKPGDE
jgi:cobalamin biosynthesis Mg chelatase CobN